MIVAFKGKKGRKRTRRREKSRDNGNANVYKQKSVKSRAAELSECVQKWWCYSLSWHSKLDYD